MDTSANDAVAAFHAATSEGEREYWTRQIMIRQIRAHRERNREILQRAHLILVMTVSASVVGGVAAIAAYVWLRG